MKKEQKRKYKNAIALKQFQKEIQEEIDRTANRSIITDLLGLRFVAKTSKNGLRIITES